MRELVLQKFNEALEQTEKGLQVEDLADDAILLETGLDSLGFAILVALLEEELDYDPFQLMDSPVYPTTFGEFVAIFEKYNG
jgi:aryl carrier-like protein